MLDLQKTNPAARNYERNLEDDRPEEKPPIYMDELWDNDPERAVEIFLDVIEGYEFEIWAAMRGPVLAKLLEKMEQKANRIQR